MKREEKDEPFILLFSASRVRIYEIRIHESTNPRIHECTNPRIHECPNMTNGVQCREFAKVELKE
ncbi:MAG: hypothetical protein IPM91_05205 [Bacteroidetes bacterium]|nr:hypothetical protein [Bacteroidota bacterium]